MQGTVMDVSAGTKQNEQAGDFPNGVPCASDMSMKDWMGCVYQQRSFPTNFAGVPVSINAVDPNGNYIHIGDASTNSYGLFHYSWTTPNVPGDYSVYASFPGTNGYWPSSAATSVIVTSAPTASASPTPTPTTSIADQYVLLIGITLIVLVIIIGAALAALILRKHP